MFYFLTNTAIQWKTALKKRSSVGMTAKIALDNYIQGDWRRKAVASVNHLDAGFHHHSASTIPFDFYQQSGQQRQIDGGNRHRDR